MKITRCVILLIIMCIHLQSCSNTGTYEWNIINSISGEETRVFGEYTYFSKDNKIVAQNSSENLTLYDMLKDNKIKKLATSNTCGISYILYGKKVIFHVQNSIYISDIGSNNSREIIKPDDYILISPDSVPIYVIGNILYYSCWEQRYNNQRLYYYNLEEDHGDFIDYIEGSICTATSIYFITDRLGGGINYIRRISKSNENQRSINMINFIDNDIYGDMIFYPALEKDKDDNNIIYFYADYTDRRSGEKYKSKKFIYDETDNKLEVID